MALSPEMRAEIEKEMAALKENEFLRAGMAYDDFVGEQTDLLGQAKEDLAVLEAAGLDGSLIPKYYGYLEMLTLEHAERVNAEGEQHEAVEEFRLRMPQAEAVNKALLATARFVLAREGDKDARRVYDKVREGFGDMDTLQDNVTLVSFARDRAATVSKVRPGGQVIDDAFLDKAEAEAVDLIKIRGQATAARDNASEHVDRQNRLITLCVLAKREIKLFAEMAFYDDVERYNRYYASDQLRAYRRESEKNQLAADAMPAAETATE